jgi:hypothetical protein
MIMFKPALLLMLTLAACGGDEAKKPEAPAEVAAPTPTSYVAKQDPLVGGPYPTLLLSQAWFMTVDGKPKPGPARLEIWRKGPAGWVTSRLEDPDSNVFHKAILNKDGSIMTIGGMGAHFKRWRFSENTWKQETLWTESWTDLPNGKFDRFRDIEVGDVDGDGKDEYVIATHDYGVIAIFNPGENGNKPRILQLDKKADTFVHEIEIGDIDGDGKLEFFATPSDRNKASHSQAGEVVMYKFEGDTFVRSVVDAAQGTHAKEILVTDIDGDGKSEIFGVYEGEKKKGSKVLLKPVSIRQYKRTSKGEWQTVEIATINDAQTRFLIAEDFDGDGKKELIAAAWKTGLYRITPQDDGSWITTRFESNSSSFEHAIVAADIDNDGIRELYVAADKQQELNRYDWNKATNTFDKTLIGKLQPKVYTWNIVGGQL